jgi:beta-glucosidase
MMWDQVRGHFYGRSMEEASALSLLAGTDICTGREHDCYLMDAIKQGMVSEKTLDRALIRSFTARFRLGEFDDPNKVPFHSIGAEFICSDKNTKLAEDMARESITLLKNENNILPLDSGRFKKIAVIGPNAIYRQMGSYSIGAHPRSAADTRISIPPLAGIKAKASELGIEISYAKGWHITDRPMFDLPGSEVLLREVRESGKTLEEYLEERMPIETRVRHAEQDAIMEAHKNDPIPERRHPVVDPDAGRDDKELFDEALKTASQADAVVVIAGTDPSVTSEGRDRATLTLPYDQDGKIRQILKTNPKTVVVCVSVGPTVGEFLRQVPGLVYAVYAGQSQGKAIADVLFGSYSPSGRTTQSWYSRDEDMPHLNEYGIRIHDTMTQMGRTYLYYLGKLVFPFGYGLSYTKFDYANFALSKTCLDANDTLVISTDVTNTGNMAGYEVVQLYTRKIKCYDNKPYKQLKGFQKVWLEPGETKTVSIALPLSEMRFWDYPRNRFAVDSGTYSMWFGRDCDEASVIVKGEIEIHGQWDAPLSAVTLLADRYILKPGEESDLEVAATLMNAVHLDVRDEPVILTSSDPSVARITSGRVRAAAPGAAVITAELTRGGVTKRCSLPIRVI